MNKNDLSELLIRPEISIKEAVKVIDKAAKQIVLVVDKENKLLGTITDGDIRRGIIKGIDLENKVTEIMNEKFFSLPYDTPREEIMAVFKQKTYHQIPLINEKGIIKDVAILNELIKGQRKENKVVLMVGGLGTRLRPLTKDTPKPLLPVGDRPILQTIIEQFKSYGYYRFVFCTNYKADQIEEFFGSGDRFEIEIEYVKEKKRLGTAGALSLLDEKVDYPFIVMNGDLLTRLNFDSMMKYHQDGNYKMTIGSREYSYQIPYGVVDIKDEVVNDLVEKPSHSVFVNAGVYILNPELLEMVPFNKFYDMTDLINELIEEEKTVGAFPIREYWADIGQHADYQKAQEEYWSRFAQVAAGSEE